LSKDIIILTSDKTPTKYINYLNERNYDNFNFGKDHVDIEKSLGFLYKKFKIKKILVDTGKILGNHLLSKGFINELSLLIHPIIMGRERYYFFDNIHSDINLNLNKIEKIDDNLVWMVYKIK
jgi:2,5-diamino-6-(ribosylamino)-4(3H)-pyrimidinone 5'-phosphate reductase